MLLIFSRAISNAFYQLAGSDDYLGPDPHEAAQGLSRLGWELTREIDRRIRGLSRAGKVWEERAKAMNTATGEEG